MPELPEVETIVRGLAPRLAGRRIESIEVGQPRVLINDIRPAAGSTIRRVRRWGKHIVADLGRGHLVIHLGMTGQLLFDAPPGPHTHARFHLGRGHTLVYNDIRQFGRLEFSERLPARLEELGPDPLELSEAEFVRRLRSRRAMAKALLLDQRFLRGLGNIYADEALHRAGIHPRAIAARLRPPRAAALYGAIQQVLRDAIEHRGSSVSDYIASDGRRGSFQLRHQVYRRTGLPCANCGTAIRRILVAARGTHFCPRCQRR